MRVGHLDVAVLAHHEAEVGMGTERLVRRAEPVGQALRARLRDDLVEAATDDEDRQAGERRALDRHAEQDLAPGRAGFVRLLAEQVLDPPDVLERQVAVVALEPLRQGRPADPLLAVHVADLAQLVRPGRDAQLARQLGADEHEARPAARRSAALSASRPPIP